MLENKVGSDEGPSPELDRYRLLLDITDLIARAQSLPVAFKELAPPVLALTGGELLNLSLHDPRRDCMLTQYWKKNHESGEFEALAVDEAASGWAWKHQKADRDSRYRARGAFPWLRPCVTQSWYSFLHRPSHKHALQPFWSAWAGQKRSRSAGRRGPRISFPGCIDGSAGAGKR